MERKKYIVIVAFGDDAYEIQEMHEGEVHTAKEWYDIYSEPWGKYNPTEIREYDTMDEMLDATLDPGSFLPKYYQYEGVSDSAWHGTC